MIRRCLTLSVMIAAGARSHAMAAGTVAAEFLKFAVGRPAGMSEASGSLVQDASAVYWNPAGLGGLERADVYASHNNLPLTLKHDFFGAALPVRALGSVFGYSVQALTQDSIDKLDNTGSPAGNYSATDMAQTLAWASRWGEIRGGLSVRYVQQTLDGTSGSAVAGNAGVQKDFGEHWTAGVSLANFGTSLKLGSESYPLPQTERGGAGLRLFEDDLLLAADVSNVESRGVRGHLGGQYRIYPARQDRRGLFEKGGISVRAGCTVGKNSDDAYSGAAYGVSLDLRSFRADFAYQPFGDLGNSFQFGLGYKW